MGIPGQSWNGGGMAKLSDEEREAIFEDNAEKLREKHAGWPKSIQKEGQIETYAKATLEWDMRMAWSKSK